MKQHTPMQCVKEHKKFNHSRANPLVMFVLQVVVEAAPSELCGGRWARFFEAGKKTKAHALFVFASPFGK
jgi:hypothetical protein